MFTPVLSLRGVFKASPLSRGGLLCMAGTDSADLYKHGLQSLSKEPFKMEATLKRLGKLEIVNTPGPSAFVKPYTVNYSLDGRQRRWDAVQSHGSVGALVYHKQHDAVVIVRQFRPAVWAWSKLEAEGAGQAEPPLTAAFTYELCAGIIDKSKSLEEITIEEIREETGYEVEASALKKVCSYASSVGIGGSVHNMFTVDVDDSMRRDDGGGIEESGEAIEVLLLPLSHALEFVADDSLKKSAGLLFGLTWLYNRQRRL